MQEVVLLSLQFYKSKVEVWSFSISDGCAPICFDGYWTNIIASSNKHGNSSDFRGGNLVWINGCNSFNLFLMSVSDVQSGPDFHSVSRWESWQSKSQSSHFFNVGL